MLSLLSTGLERVRAAIKTVQASRTCIFPWFANMSPCVTHAALFLVVIVMICDDCCCVKSILDFLKVFGKHRQMRMFQAAFSVSKCSQDLPAKILRERRDTCGKLRQTEHPTQACGPLLTEREARPSQRGSVNANLSLPVRDTCLCRGWNVWN